MSRWRYLTQGHNRRSDGVDLEHHAGDPTVRDFTQVNRVMGRARRNLIHLTRFADASRQADYIDGADKGTRITTSFEAIGANRTRVTVRSHVSVPRGMGLLATIMGRSWAVSAATRTGAR